MIIFWLICVALTIAVAALVTTPLWRGTSDAGNAPDVAIYSAQLDEIDRDVARGAIPAAEADGARAEVSRRLLMAHRRAKSAVAASTATSPALSVVLIAALAASGLGGYLWLGAPGYPDLPRAMRIENSETARATRPTQAQAEAAAAPPPVLDLPQDYRDMVAQLRAIVPNRPDDLQGWTLLAMHEARLGNYAAAARAQEHIIGLMGDTADTAAYERQVDLMVAAADGFISPEAEVVIRKIIETTPTSIPANYYLGALYDQTDRPDIAYRLWRPIVDAGDPEQFHVAMARGQIEATAQRAGVDFVLPAVRGPDAAAVAAATDMTDEDRQAMIGTMVAGLAERLATEGGPASEWARLISAYGVLGQPENASAIWAEAAQTFADDPAAMEALRAAAASAGVLE